VLPKFQPHPCIPATEQKQFRSILENAVVYWQVVSLQG